MKTAISSLFVLATLLVAVYAQTTVTTTMVASASVGLLTGDKVCGVCAEIVASDAPLASVLLKWDLSSLPSDAAITVAELNIFISKQGGDIPTIRIAPAERAWNNSIVGSGRDAFVGNLALTGEPTYYASSFPTANWTTPGGYALSGQLWELPLDNNGASDPTLTGLASADLLALVQSWKSNSANNVGLSVRVYGTGTSYFASKDNSDTTKRPTLTLTYSTTIGAPPPPTGSANYAPPPRFGGVGTGFPTRYSAPSSSGAIIGGVIGGIMAVILIISIITIFLRR